MKSVKEIIEFLKNWSKRPAYPQEPEGSENRCPICGTHWDHHEFGVPHPYCPQEPLPGKSWYNDSL